MGSTIYGKEEALPVVGAAAMGDNGATMPTSERSTPLNVWLAAARPRTLMLATATIGLGAFLAAGRGRFDGPVVALALVTALLLQILSNLANDYGDARHGADHAGRAGPPRAVQSGQITAAAMRRAMGGTAVAAMLTGLLLVWRAFGADALPLLLLFLLLGAAAVWAAIAYTASDRPYGYAGLGDLAVFLFFGWVGTVGTYVLQAGTLDGRLFLPATSCGLLAVAVLNVNNIRDIESDRAAGKRSLPVRLGLAWARRYHWLLLAGGLLAALVFVLLEYRSLWQFLFLLTAPLLWRNGRYVASQPSQALDPMLKQLSISTLLFVLTFGLGGLLA